MDETTPLAGGGVCYAVVAGVLPLDAVTAGEARRVVRAVVGQERLRPFHWSREGPAARSRMVQALADLAVSAQAVVVQCGPKRQESARAVALTHIELELVAAGCTQVLIEGCTPAQDGRDQALLAEIQRTLPDVSCVTHAWRRKSEELLWIADAIGGAVHDHLVGAKHDWYEQVAKVTGLEIAVEPLPPR